jgi:3-hydroxybutyryl-CoA dehydrogenase
MQIKKVGILGCGLMGSGIVEVCARSGYEVVVREVNDDFLKRGLDKLEGSMNTGVEKGKLKKEERDAARARIRGTTKVADLKDVDCVIEAIVEDRVAKKEIWTEIGKVVKKDALLATNTSSIPLSSIAPATGNPERFLGLHFMNPVPIMKLVEIVKGIQTTDHTLAEGKAFIESLGKTTITAKDTPAFIINALLVPFIIEAVRLVEAGTATPEDIDKGMKLGCNMPMGPIELLDFVGLDTTLSISEVLFSEFKEPRYAAPPLLRRMVESGFMGKKSGRGFYDYSKKGDKR